LAATLVADARVAGDVLDHLGVVVGGDERLARAAVGHGQPADEVGEPGVGGVLLLRVLVQVVIEFPGFVADPQVVVLLAGQVVEDHKVGQQDLIHPPDGLEAVQVMLGRLGLDVPGLTRQCALAGWTRSPRSSSTLVTGCWASQSISRPGCSLRSSAAIATSRRA
jgi:hypothetical protein